MTRIISICHPGGGTSGVFHTGAADAGCVIEEWTPAERPQPPRPLGDYAALIVLGGDQNVCEQDRFPYLTRSLGPIRYLALGAGFGSSGPTGPNVGTQPQPAHLGGRRRSLTGCTRSSRAG